MWSLPEKSPGHSWPNVLWRVSQVCWAQPARSSPKISLLCERPDQSISRKLSMATRSMALQMSESVTVGTCVGLGSLPHSGPEPATTGILFFQLGHQTWLELILIIWFLFAFLTIGSMSPSFCFMCLRYTQAECRETRTRTLSPCELPFERCVFPLWLTFRLQTWIMKKLFFWPRLPSTRIYQCLNTNFKKHAVTKSVFNCYFLWLLWKFSS